MRNKFIRVTCSGEILPINVDHIMYVIPWEPDYKCRIVLSDGRDLFSVLTVDEVMALIEEQPENPLRMLGSRVF